jgi:acyl-coenzyme A thioesterase PaaI-like protein
VDYSALADALSQGVPLNGHLGLTVDEVGPGHARVTLPDDPRLQNHVASQHAGGMFSAGEAASGGAFLGAFAEQLAGITPLAERAEIAYKKIARGPIEARAKLEGADALTRQLEADGVVRFPVEVELRDGDEQLVAEMTVHWYVRRNPQ